MSLPPNGQGPIMVALTVEPRWATAWCATCGWTVLGPDPMAMATEHLAREAQHTVVSTAVSTIQRTLTVGLTP